MDYNFTKSGLQLKYSTTKLLWKRGGRILDFRKLQEL